MQLTYRGTHYTFSAPNAESETIATEGRYRGITVKIAAPSRMPQNSMPLSYRGVAY